MDDRAPAPAYFTPAPPRILAHRGLQRDAPENSMLAFEQAAAIGCTHLETDVHATKDGVAVICHDRDLKRTTGIDAKIEDLTLQELRKIDLGHGQTFMTLQELLAAFPGHRFNIDIKALAAAAPAAEAIIAAGAMPSVLITSFNQRRRLETVHRMPGVKTSASAPSFVLAFFFARLGLARAAARVLKHIDAVQVPERIAYFQTCTPRTVRIFHAAGCEIHVWTVNDASVMRRLFSHGVDGIFTDRADIGLEVLKGLAETPE